MIRREIDYDAFLGDQRKFTVFPAQVKILQSPIINKQNTLQSLYPLSRPQCLLEEIRFFRVKKENKQDKQINKIKPLTPDLFDSDGFWLRGLTLAILIFCSWRGGYPN